MTSHPATGLPCAIAAVAGIGLWIAASLVSGRREAWDAPVYWSVAFPVALAACALFGYLWPRKPWRWALTLFLFQFVGMAIRNGELGGLWPLGLLLFAALSLPGMVVAQGGAAFRRFLEARER